MMKKSRIMTIVVAAAVLAVFASGYASASEALFGLMASRDYGSYATKNYDASGEKYVSRYDQVGWNNDWGNCWSSSSTGYVVEYCSELNLPSGGQSLYAGQPSTNVKITGSLNGNVGDYYVTARHTYQGNAPARSAPLNGGTILFHEQF
ncbi:hypothetical protein [Methanocella sp. MCL-LM]|uniref:hypothetical protein n=1 Tax=Methanocella sp. MCL-LM TaxID=3412035 RepID=UPI003C73A4ED